MELFRKGKSKIYTFPVGLFLLWKYSNYGSTAKKVITGIFVLAIAVSAFSDNSTKNTNQQTQKVEQQKTVEQKKVLSTADEKIIYQNFKNQIQKGLVAVDNDWDTLWSPTITNFANGSIDEKTTFATLRQLEQNLINDEMIIYAAYNNLYDNLPANTVISQETQNKMKQITDDYQQWIQQRRKSSENFRQALGMGQINEAKIQETIDMINRADAIMLGATGKLAELENKFK